MTSTPDFLEEWQQVVDNLKEMEDAAFFTFCDMIMVEKQRRENVNNIREINKQLWGNHSVKLTIVKTEE